MSIAEGSAGTLTGSPPRRSHVPEGAGRHSWGLILALQSMTAIVSCLITLGVRPFWMDEGFTFVTVDRPFGSLMRLLTTDEANMSPYMLALYVWRSFGDDASTLRLLSVVFAVATVPVVATMADRTLGRPTAVIAGFLVALHPMVVTYAQELRGYTLAMLAASVSMLAFLERVERPRRAASFVWVAASAIGVYAHFFVGLVLVAQLVSLLAHPKGRAVLRGMAGPILALVVLLLPLEVFVLGKGSSQIAWIPPLSWEGIKTWGVWFSGDLSYGPALLVISAGLLVLGVRAAALRSGDSTGVRIETERWRRLLVVFWLVVPLIITALVSVVVPVWTERYLIVALPAALILIAHGCATLPRRVVVPAAVVVLALYVATLTTVYGEDLKWGSDWREASAELSLRAGDDPVIFAPASGRNVYRYYQQTAGLNELNDVTLAPGDAFYGVTHARTASPLAIASRLASAEGDGAWLVEDISNRPLTRDCLEAAGLNRASSELFGYLKVSRLEPGPDAVEAPRLLSECQLP